MTSKEALEVLDLIKRKSIAVGFIQLLIKENCGGVIEYNDYICNKKLYLTKKEYKTIKEWLEL